MNSNSWIRNIAKAYVEINNDTIQESEELDEAKKKLSQKQTMKVLDALESNKSGVIRGLRDLLKDLKVTDGKVNFNVTKTINLIKKTIDALKTLEKDSTKEFDRLDATLEVD